MSFVSECVDNFREIITQKYCQFSGRARRREFWMYALAEFIVLIVLSLLDKFLLRADGLLVGIVSVILYLPGIALSVRRLHDIDKNWYWLLFPNLLYFLVITFVVVGVILYKIHPFDAISSDIVGLFTIFVMIISVSYGIVMLIWFLTPGDRGDNRFGPDPKDASINDSNSTNCYSLDCFINNFREVVTTKYCCFSGRTRRREYWMFVWVYYVILAVATKVETSLHLLIDRTGDADLGILSIIIFLALLLPGLGILVRRLHDISKSAWWIMLLIIPIIGILWLLILNCKEGDRFDNKFGPDPKAERVFATDTGNNPPAV